MEKFKNEIAGMSLDGGGAFPAAPLGHLGCSVPFFWEKKVRKNSQVNISEETPIPAVQKVLTLELIPGQEQQ